MIRLRTLATAVLTALVSTACTANPPAPTASGSPAPATSAPSSALKACPANPGYSCGKLTVPVNRTDPSRGELVLDYIAADNADAPKGVLLALTGGPGQPGVHFLGNF